MANWVIFKGATVCWNNLSGEKFRDGKRSLGLVIDDLNKAEQMKAEGWNVKIDYKEDGTFFARMPIYVRFDKYPPLVKKDINGRLYDVHEETIGTLQGANISCVDVVLSPSAQMAAYVKTLRIYIQVDPIQAEMAEEEYPTED